jgi:hypothetical protein
MNRFLFGITVILATGFASAADVGVSLSVGQPGFYGRIDLGNVQQPQLIYSAPVIIQAIPVGVVRQPIYLRVPPGHEKHWGKHCAKYRACGLPVYFVDQGWYENVYAPRYRREHGDHDGGRDEHGRKGHGKDKKGHRDD